MTTKIIGLLCAAAVVGLIYLPAKLFFLLVGVGCVVVGVGWTPALWLKILVIAGGAVMIIYGFILGVRDDHREPERSGPDMMDRARARDRHLLDE